MPEATDDDAARTEFGQHGRGRHRYLGLREWRRCRAGQALGADQAALQELQRIGMTIYFDHDRSEIKSEYVSVIAAHANT